MKVFIFLALPIVYVLTAFLQVIIGGSSHHVVRPTGHRYDILLILAVLLCYYLLLKLWKKISYEAGAALLVVLSLVLSVGLSWCTLAYTYDILTINLGFGEHFLFIDCLPLYALLAISHRALWLTLI